MTDHVQLLFWLLMKLKVYGFDNFAVQHLVPYEYASISLVVIEALCGYVSNKGLKESYWNIWQGSMKRTWLVLKAVWICCNESEF